MQNFAPTGAKLAGSSRVRRFCSSPRLEQERDPYTTPLSYQRDGEDLIVIGANLASSRISDWYLNILASPLVTVEVGEERFQAHATVMDGERRLRLLARVQAAWAASRAQSPGAA